ncbi:DUF2249 domain-containing protein [Halobacteria archaeon AArc-curdl1]|uniref:DUF2249 domain-containing protein n=1 Tax=Natronosalvus hydrolyticus TaxID=2979988 RepID=A0AAP2Z9M9_9EURY|nr:DUF2249 domain-containing protein [Halobacteria archaeon AArc-curdl1]
MTTHDADRVLDAREVDGEPFSPIMDELDALEADETFLLINSFEPEPLYNILKQRGLSYEPTEVESGEWHVLIEHV